MYFADSHMHSIVSRDSESPVRTWPGAPWPTA